MGSKPCLNSCGEWCFLSFEGKKSILEANFEGPLGLQAQAGSIFWIRTLVASILSTCGWKTDSVWQSYGRFSEHRSIIWQPMKELPFPATRFDALSRNFVSSVLKVLFPHIACSVPRIPSCPWLSDTYFTPCHRAKQGEIRHTIARFSWISNQMGLARSSSKHGEQRFSLLRGLMIVLTLISRIFFQRSVNGFKTLSE